MCKTSNTRYSFSHRLTTDCVASPQASIAELANFGFGCSKQFESYFTSSE